jgi:hypothetical protein
MLSLSLMKRRRLPVSDFIKKHYITFVSAVCSFTLGVAIGVVVTDENSDAPPRNGVLAAEIASPSPYQQENSIVVDVYDTEDASLPTPSPDYFIIGEYEGKVAVFYPDMTIKEITEKPISSLSQEDAASLSAGIRVYDDESLFRLLQDYDS